MEIGGLLPVLVQVKRVSEIGLHRVGGGGKQVRVSFDQPSVFAFFHHHIPDGGIGLRVVCM